MLSRLAYRLGYWLGSSNNNRAKACWIITGIWFIFVIFHGFGSPLLNSAVSDIFRSEHNADIYAAWEGEPERKSWTPVVILLLLAAFSAIYTVIANREEALAIIINWFTRGRITRQVENEPAPSTGRTNRLRNFGSNLSREAIFDTIFEAIKSAGRFLFGKES